MKYRIVKCEQNNDMWYEIYYKLLWMWLPVEGAIESTMNPPRPRMFCTPEQAQHYIDMRAPMKKKASEELRVVRTTVSEHEH